MEHKHTNAVASRILANCEENFRHYTEQRISIYLSFPGSLLLSSCFAISNPHGRIASDTSVKMIYVVVENLVSATTQFQLARRQMSSVFLVNVLRDSFSYSGK